MAQNTDRLSYGPELDTGRRKKAEIADAIYRQGPSKWKTVKKRRENRLVSHIKYIDMLNITTNNWHNVCRRLETQSEMLAKQQVGGEISAIVKRFSKTPNSYKEKSSKFYAILKNHKYSSFNCERKQLCTISMGGRSFLNLFLYTLRIDICSKVWIFIKRKRTSRFQSPFPSVLPNATSHLQRLAKR